MFKEVPHYVLCCDCCGHIIANEATKEKALSYGNEVQGRILCDDCYEASTACCAVCNEPVLDDDAFYCDSLLGGKPICKSCLESVVFPDVVRCFVEAHLIHQDNISRLYDDD